MIENKLEIILSVIDEASDKIKYIKEEAQKSAEGIREAFRKAGEATEDFGQRTKQLGKTISNVGQTMAFFGGAITAPFILALKNSSEHSTELKIRIDNLKATFDDFQMKMATAVIPIVDRFSNVIFQFNSYLNSLDPAMVRTVMQATFLAGIFFTLTGIVIVLLGKILVLEGGVLILSGKFMALISAATPFFLITAAVGTLIFAMMKLQWVSNTIMSTFQVLFLTLKNGFDGIVIAVERVVGEVLTVIQWIVDAMGRIPGPTRAMFQNLSNNIRGITETLKYAIESHVIDIQTNVNTISNIFQTGVGTWSQSFDSFKLNIDKVVDKIKTIGTTTKTVTETTRELWLKQLSGMQTALGAMSSALSTAAAENKKFAAAAKVVAIGLAIVNTAVGITNCLAIPPPWLGHALAAIMAVAGAIQIATIMNTPLATGGIVTRPTNALIGEAGPEAIIPLDRYGGRFGTTQNFHIEINYPVVRSDEDIDRLTEEISLRLARETERL